MVLPERRSQPQANKDILEIELKIFALGRSGLSAAGAYQQQHFNWILSCPSIERTKCSPMPVAGRSSSNEKCGLYRTKKLLRSLVESKGRLPYQKLHQNAGEFLRQLSGGLRKCFLLFS